MDTFPSGLAADSQASPARTEAPIEIHSLSLTKRFLAASGEGAPRLECLEDKSICEIRCLARGSTSSSGSILSGIRRDAKVAKPPQAPRHRAPMCHSRIYRQTVG